MDRADTFQIDMGCSVIDSSSQVIVVQQDGQAIGLLVAELHDVPEFEARQIIPSPFSGDNGMKMVSSIIKANEGKVLIQMLDVQFLFSLLTSRKNQSGLPHPDPSYPAPQPSDLQLVA